MEITVSEYITNRIRKLGYGCTDNGSFLHISLLRLRIDLTPFVDTDTYQIKMQYSLRKLDRDGFKPIWEGFESSVLYEKIDEIGKEYVRDNR